MGGGEMSWDRYDQAKVSAEASVTVLCEYVEELKQKLAEARRLAEEWRDRNVLVETDRPPLPWEVEK